MHSSLQVPLQFFSQVEVWTLSQCTSLILSCFSYSVVDSFLWLGSVMVVRQTVSCLTLEYFGIQRTSWSTQRLQGSQALWLWNKPKPSLLLWQLVWGVCAYALCLGFTKQSIQRTLESLSIVFAWTFLPCTKKPICKITFGFMKCAHQLMCSLHLASVSETVMLNQQASAVCMQSAYCHVPFLYIRKHVNLQVKWKKLRQHCKREFCNTNHRTLEKVTLKKLKHVSKGSAFQSVSELFKKRKSEVLAEITAIHNIDSPEILSMVQV